MQPTAHDEADTGASGQAAVKALSEARKITALRRQLDVLRAAFLSATRQLTRSRGDLLVIREEAICVAKEHRASEDRLVASSEKLDSSNKELLATNRNLRKLLEQLNTSSGNPLSSGNVDLRPLLANWMDAPADAVLHRDERCGADKLVAWRENAARRMANLTPRQREIMVLVVKGHPNKVIAFDLQISQRTVENHRASIMKKTESKSLPALARLALFASANGADELRDATQPR